MGSHTEAVAPANESVFQLGLVREEAVRCGAASRGERQSDGFLFPDSKGRAPIIPNNTEITVDAQGAQPVCWTRPGSEI